MLEIYTVAFFGHRYIDNPFKVEELLEDQIRTLIHEKEYVDFLVGRNGEFDQCVSSTVLRVRKNIRDDNSSLVLMLPYPTAEYINNQNYFEDYYSDIEISYTASKAHPNSYYTLLSYAWTGASRYGWLCAAYGLQKRRRKGGPAPCAFGNAGKGQTGAGRCLRILGCVRCGYQRRDVRVHRHRLHTAGG